MFRILTTKEEIEGFLEDLCWKADQLVINPFGERVWLKQCDHGITDCCPIDAPCEHHAALTHSAPGKIQ